jgi:MFS family permease
MVVMWGSYLAFGVFLKPVITEFGWNRAMTSGAFSLAMVIQGLVGIAMGGMTDRLGPRMVMTLCGIFLGAGYLLMSQISGLWQLYLFYGVIIGIGMGGGFAPLASTVSRWFITRRGIMTGIVVGGLGIGTLIGPPIASKLISVYDWRMSYLVIGCAVLVIVIVIAQLLRQEPRRMGLLPYGISQKGEHALKFSTGGFSLKESVKFKQFWLIFAMMFCFGFAVFAVVVHLVPHATDLGIAAVIAALILAVSGGLDIIGRLGLGSASDAIGNRQIYIISFIVLAAALFLVIPAEKAWMLFLFAAAVGLAHGGMGAAEAPLVAEHFGLSSHGLILGVIALGFTIGGAVGPSAAGYLYDSTGNYRIAFGVCAGAAVIGLILSLLLRPIANSPVQKPK